MTIRIDSSALEKVARDAREKGLNDVGLRATALCQQEAPVRTGNLRRNTQFERATGPMRYVRVNFNAPYSVYVILGTRYQSANDFPHRALDRMRVA